MKLTTTGVDAYNAKYIRMSELKIEKSDPEWMLKGFYYSMIVKNSYKTAYEYLASVSSFLKEK